MFSEKQLHETAGPWDARLDEMYEGFDHDQNFTHHFPSQEEFDRFVSLQVADYIKNHDAEHVSNPPDATLNAAFAAVRGMIATIVETGKFHPDSDVTMTHSQSTR